MRKGGLRPSAAARAHERVVRVQGRAPQRGCERGATHGAEAQAEQREESQQATRPARRRRAPRGGLSMLPRRRRCRVVVVVIRLLLVPLVVRLHEGGRALPCGLPRDGPGAARRVGAHWTSDAKRWATPMGPRGGAAGWGRLLACVGTRRGRAHLRVAPSLGNLDRVARLQVERALVAHLTAEQRGGRPRVPRVRHDPLLDEAPLDIDHEHGHRVVEVGLELGLRTHAMARQRGRDGSAAVHTPKRVAKGLPPAS